MRDAPPSLVLDPVAEDDLGTLRSGKEAQIELVRWTDATGATSLVARKRYLPREVKAKGTLEALGVQRASAFRHDVAYREGRQFRRTRDRRAIEQMSTHGKRLLQDRWTSHEHDVMRVLWDRGMAVPYPISYRDDVFHLAYVGDHEQAAPQLARARLSDGQARRAWGLVVDGLHEATTAGWAHGDLSAYNLLWWDDEVWFIDFPQAVDLAANPQGLGFLHRDCENIATWFARRGVDADGEVLFAELLAGWRP